MPLIFIETKLNLNQFRRRAILNVKKHLTKSIVKLRRTDEILRQ